MSSKPTPKNGPSTPDDQSEVLVKGLIVKIRQGDKAAFTELVSRYRNQVGALAYRMVSDYDEAADITQIVFMKMAKNIWRYDDNKKFYTWLHRITVNASIDYIRKHRRHQHEPLEEFHDIQESNRRGPEFNYQRRQLSHQIECAANTLNDKQKSAFMLRDIEGCKLDDVADIMEMPEATVRWYLHRARSKIRKELVRRCPQLLIALGIR
ncbi:MAG: RNA polymerase sigma factor [candidate division Zixibacteria bacterium]|nr:RNA polymerase sigma factor [candidate division Zixibacteria bacterium]MDH3938330.1 RNA polymerase sigma factor [candidate division Zixibacteria bacterium]MDH4035838.1 RNA polymerase sigma factor [candidate division Zixibacteria bacterium]